MAVVNCWAGSVVRDVVLVWLSVGGGGERPAVVLGSVALRRELSPGPDLRGP